MNAMNVGRLKCVSSVPGIPGVPSVRSRFLPSCVNLLTKWASASTIQMFFSGSYGLISTSCGRPQMLSHCDQSSIILPLRSKTTMTCSQRQSTPARPSLPSGAALPKLGVALAASRVGTPPPTGNLRLGPICGSHVVPLPRPIGRTGNSPFWATITRSGLSGNTSVDCDHVHPWWFGRLSASGRGQFCTGSYGPNASLPPFCPGTAANPSPGIFFGCCPSTVLSLLLTRIAAVRAITAAAIFIVRTLISVLFDFRIWVSAEPRQPYAGRIIESIVGTHRGHSPPHSPLAARRSGRAKESAEAAEYRIASHHLLEETSCCARSVLFHHPHCAR